MRHVSDGEFDVTEVALPLEEEPREGAGPEEEQEGKASGLEGGILASPGRGSLADLEYLDKD